jgi:uncharacterized membrane protein YfcA
MILLTKWIVIVFGVFIIYVGLLMFFSPEKARATLMKAGSTNFINYAEITIRMIPALAMILYADLSKYPDLFKLFGWFMLGTSIILYFVPRRLHHSFSLQAAEILKPQYVKWLSPFSLLFGSAIIYFTIG